ncbi:MAG: site-specific DNA-methyltransferase [Symploca sp. SIO1A3]|nr:site-specific DNA-methyltransferase [Symploca sp. SIO1A3]
MSKLLIQWLSPDKLTPYEHNPKAHPAAQIEKIVRAIAEVGFDQPIVADENLLVIKGHGRLAAANQMGLTQVPVIVRKDLTEAQKRAARIADNKVAESDWLDIPLKFELQELKGLDYDLTLTGFDESELSELLGLYEEEDDGGGGNSTPPTENLTPRCKPGEVWALGEHRLLCGSSLDEDLVTKFLCDRDITLVWSDPPYGMKCQNKDGKIGGGSSIKFSKRLNKVKYSSKTYLPVAGDDSTQTALASFELCNRLFPSAVQVWWGANHYGVPPSSCWLVWDKQNEGTCFADAELAWTNQTSAVRIFRHTWNGMLKAGEEANEARCHPNQKPQALARWVFESYGSAGNIIFDPFAGSGCSFLAAESLGNRIVFGVELIPEYCELTMQRWEKKTGREAELASEQMNCKI